MYVAEWHYLDVVSENCTETEATIQKENRARRLTFPRAHSLTTNPPFAMWLEGSRGYHKLAQAARIGHIRGSVKV